MFDEVTIRQFERAWFKKDYTTLSFEDFTFVYTQYIDVSGLYEGEDFEKVCYINYLDNRINSIKIAVKLQKDFLKTFKFPFEANFEFFKKFGYKITWNGNEEEFIKKLERIEIGERKYVSLIETKQKELDELRKKDNKKEDKESQRASFIRMLNSLGKIGYKIDRDKTTVEDLAYMIKQQFEENKLIK